MIWSNGRAVRRVGLALVLGLVIGGLAFAVAPTASAQTLHDIEIRDRLIADQEALLNTYRCMFGIDTQVVPGSCSNGSPALPSQNPSQFSGNPTVRDIAVRDQLVADQEALLNIYRCKFNIDTELAPDGCQNEETTPTPEPTEEDTPEHLGPIPHNAFAEEYFGWIAFATECGDVGFGCNDPTDTQTFLQGMGTLLGCEIDPNTWGCVGFGHFAMDRVISSRSCPEGWYLDFFINSRLCWHPSHPDFGSMISQYIHPS